jgi:hypothetical protein
MSLSANYNVGSPSAPKYPILGTPSPFALANLFKLTSRLHAALDLKKLLESLTLLLCGQAHVSQD